MASNNPWDGAMFGSMSAAGEADENEGPRYIALDEEDKRRGPSGLDKTVLKTISFTGFSAHANTSEVDVKDGRIVRIRPLHYDRDYDLSGSNPWRYEERGVTFEPSTKELIPPFSLVYKKRVYSKNRILYPLKRVDWNPDGERNPQNRGISKYERISWDEAAQIVADELLRVGKEYGPYSVYAVGDGHGESKCVHGPHGCNTHLLKLLGGYTYQARNSDSWEGWYWGSKHVWGMDPVGQATQENQWMMIAKHSDMVLFWGCDPETTPWGFCGQMSSRVCYWFNDMGVASVYVCPDLNYGAGVHADKWIPVRPNTDVALQLAIAHYWIENGLYDKDYVDTHVFGFDAFSDYVMGVEDGVAKTPAWASEICGVPSYTIKALAKKWSSGPAVIAHVNGGSYVRGPYSHEPGRMEAILLGMQALGKPGTGQLKFNESNLFGMHEYNHAPRVSVIPDLSAAYQGDFFDTPDQIIPKTIVPKAILTKEPIKWYGTTMPGYPVADQFQEYTYPNPEIGTRIHMIWTSSPCWTNCVGDGNSYIKALRDPEIETVVVQHPWFENDCVLADIVLPSNTMFETTDIGSCNYSDQYIQVVYQEQAIEPLGESKSDYEIVLEIAKKLGLEEEYTHGKSVEDYIREGFETSGVQGMIDYDEWRKHEYFLVPTAEGWEDDVPSLQKFYEDPVNNPLKTPTGLLEFKSSMLEAVFPDDDERPAVPHWIPEGATHQETLGTKRSEEFPYLLITNHPRWRVHVQLDDVPWLREIDTCKVVGADGYRYEPVWVNPVDAEKLGVVNGDIVSIYNERGEVLGGVYVTERIMPGVIYQDHGAREDPIVHGRIDRGGANNLISPKGEISRNCTGEVTSGYLIGVKKVDIEDYRRQYPKAFARPYDENTGLILESWIEGE